MRGEGEGIGYKGDGGGGGDRLQGGGGRETGIGYRPLICIFVFVLGLGWSSLVSRHSWLKLSLALNTKLGIGYFDAQLIMADRKEWHIV